MFRISSPVGATILALTVALTLGFLTLGRAQAPPKAPATLNMTDVLTGMDQAAARFSSLAADLEYTKVTVIVDDHSTETGKIYFEKSKGQPRVMLAFLDPAEKYVLFADGKVSIYRPKIAIVEEFSLAKNRGLLEQFLLLGFGTSGSDLLETYQVSLQGEQTLDGEPTVLLELVPINRDVSTKLQRIELWLSPKTWQPLQQKFYEPSKDYLIARYRNSQHNGKIAANKFKLPVRGNVRTVRPQTGN